MSDHERIWLEPAPGADEEYGRQWVQHNVWPDGIEYIRADLAQAALEEAQHDAVAAETELRIARKQLAASEAISDGETTALLTEFRKFVDLIEGRAMACDGPVTPFLEELAASSDTDKDRFTSILRRLYAIPSPVSNVEPSERRFCDFPKCDCSSGAFERCSHPPATDVATSDVIAKLQRLTTNTGRDWRSGEEFVHGAGTQDVVDTMRAALALLQGSPPSDHVERLRTERDEWKAMATEFKDLTEEWQARAEGYRLAALAASEGSTDE